MDNSKRIAEIDAELAILEQEKETLVAALLAIKEDKWSEAGLKDRLRKTILSRYGSFHNIKLVKLIMSGAYDDSYYNYESPTLLLINDKFEEVEHDINARDFCPTDEEQSEVKYNGGRPWENVTLRF